MVILWIRNDQGGSPKGDFLRLLESNFFFTDLFFANNEAMRQSRLSLKRQLTVTAVSCSQLSLGPTAERSFHHQPPAVCSLSPLCKLLPPGQNLAKTKSEMFRNTNLSSTAVTTTWREWLTVCPVVLMSTQQKNVTENRSQLWWSPVVLVTPP